MCLALFDFADSHYQIWLLLEESWWVLQTHPTVPPRLPRRYAPASAPRVGCRCLLGEDVFLPVEIFWSCDTSATQP